MKSKFFLFIVAMFLFDACKPVPEPVIDSLEKIPITDSDVDFTKR